VPGLIHAQKNLVLGVDTGASSDKAGFVSTKSNGKNGVMAGAIAAITATWNRLLWRYEKLLTNEPASPPTLAKILMSARLHAPVVIQSASHPLLPGKRPGTPVKKDRP
jgi:hypothetical protein